MKTFTLPLPLPPGKVAAVAAFGLFGLSAAVAQQPGAAADPSPSVAAAQTGTATPSEDILDIRDPYHVPAPFPWFGSVAGTLGTAGLVFGLWVLLHRRHGMLPYQVALEKLEATRPLMLEGNGKPFSLAVSEIVRVFVEASLPVRAVHRTSDEFLHDLVDQPGSPLAAHREALAEFLVHCDLAKFARWSLAVPRMEAMLVSAASFVTAIGRPVEASETSNLPT